jgi:hypothetical protein
MIRLRDYQDEAIKALFDSWISGTKRPAVVLPTGSGKTVIFSHLVREFYEWRTNVHGLNIGNGGHRSLILVHRDELADQALTKLQETDPGRTVGKIKAKDNGIWANTMVASVQTLSRDNRLQQLLGSQATSGEVGRLRRPNCSRSASDGCAPIATPCCRQSATLRRIVSASPACQPQAMLAELMCGMSAASSPTPSPRSQLKSMVAGEGTLGGR